MQASDVVLPKQEITIEEIDEIVSRIQLHVKSARTLMLYLYESQAHKVAGYKRWSDFCTDKFNLTYTPNYHSDLLRAARVERELKSATPDNLPEKTLPVRTLLQIAKKKTSCKQAAYKQAQAKDHIHSETKSQNTCPLCAQALEALRKVIRQPQRPDEWCFEVEQAISMLWKATQRSKPEAKGITAVILRI